MTLLLLLCAGGIAVQPILTAFAVRRWRASERECAWLRTRLGNDRREQAHREVADALRENAISAARAGFPDTAASLLDDADRIGRGGPA